ncbi:MAG TPA: cytochrome c peroxidase [Planctomycetaceae bacterium]|jgi:cytochrome c peroxidase
MGTRRLNIALPSGILIIATVAAFAIGITAEIVVAQGDKSDTGLLKEAQKNFEPLPKEGGTREFPVTPDRVSLGRMLFFEPRISVDGTGSCVRCHQPALYGADGLAKSQALHDKVLPRNAPTVLNSGLNFQTHWDGVFATVEEQAGKALLGPGFGNADNAAVVARLKAIPGYADLFRKTFPGESDPVTVENWGKAVGAYERTLLTPSRFDEYLGGKSDALSADERRGLKTFIETGCIECHNGRGVGGSEFRKFGVVADYWKSTHSADVDKGRFNVTKDDADLYTFKVAGLRNVAMTPPYFHDGSVGTLPEAVRVMATVQLGKDLSEEDTNHIVKFLGSLTGKLPEGFAGAPVLPAAGFRPKP